MASAQLVDNTVTTTSAAPAAAAPVATIASAAVMYDIPFDMGNAKGALRVTAGAKRVNIGPSVQQKNSYGGGYELEGYAIGIEPITAPKYTRDATLIVYIRAANNEPKSITDSQGTVSTYDPKTQSVHARVPMNEYSNTNGEKKTKNWGILDIDLRSSLVQQVVHDVQTPGKDGGVNGHNTVVKISQTYVGPVKYVQVYSSGTVNPKQIKKKAQKAAAAAAAAGIAPAPGATVQLPAGVPGAIATPQVPVAAVTTPVAGTDAAQANQLVVYAGPPPPQVNGTPAVASSSSVTTDDGKEIAEAAKKRPDDPSTREFKLYAKNTSIVHRTTPDGSIISYNGVNCERNILDILGASIIMNLDAGGLPPGPNDFPTEKVVANMRIIIPIGNSVPAWMSAYTDIAGIMRSGIANIAVCVNDKIPIEKRHSAIVTVEQKPVEVNGYTHDMLVQMTSVNKVIDTHYKYTGPFSMDKTTKLLTADDPTNKNLVQVSLYDAIRLTQEYNAANPGAPLPYISKVTGERNVATTHGIKYSFVAPQFLESRPPERRIGVFTPDVNRAVMELLELRGFVIAAPYGPIPQTFNISTTPITNEEGSPTEADLVKEVRQVTIKHFYPDFEQTVAKWGQPIPTPENLEALIEVNPKLVLRSILMDDTSFAKEFPPTGETSLILSNFSRTHIMKIAEAKEKDVFIYKIYFVLPMAEILAAFAKKKAFIVANKGVVEDSTVVKTDALMADDQDDEDAAADDDGPKTKKSKTEKKAVQAEDVNAKEEKRKALLASAMRPEPTNIRAFIKQVGEVYGITEGIGASKLMELFGAVMTNLPPLLIAIPNYTRRSFMAPPKKDKDLVTEDSLLFKDPLIGNFKRDASPLCFDISNGSVIAPKSVYVDTFKAVETTAPVVPVVAADGTVAVATTTPAAAVAAS